MDDKFTNHPHEKLIRRERELYETKSDTRDPFFRDYTRILHSNAYRRLKHKTQVFFNINNDHVCTRMEHAAHVEAVSYSIALGLDLDTELTRAIASGHDLGHAPFGHDGEKVLDALMREHLSPEYIEQICGKDPGKLFWHERNGLRFVDYIELLPDLRGIERNLCLTYAVRDGIISHCGEVNENGLIPREDDIDLDLFRAPGQYMPYTWEGCAVKISDKIAYLGRDIEDALTLNFLSEDAKQELKKLGDEYSGDGAINTTSIMHGMISDICKYSTPEKGICLGPRNLELFDRIKDFNYKYIYMNPKFEVYRKYVKLVITSIFDVLYSTYAKDDTIRCLQDKCASAYPKLTDTFTGWLCKYSSPEMVLKSVVRSGSENSHSSGEVTEETAPATENVYFNRMQPDREDIASVLENTANEKIYGNLETPDIYVRAIIDFISGMTDPFAISLFEELISYG